MMKKISFIKITALLVAGVLFFNIGTFAKNNAKTPEIKEIDASKSKFEVSKNGVVLIPFKMNTLFSFMDMKTYKTMKFPVDATQKTVGISNLSIYENDGRDLIIKIYYNGYEKNYAPEVKVQLLNGEKKVSHEKIIKKEHSGFWRRGSFVLVVSHEFNFGETKTEEIKFIGIGAK